MSDDLPPHHRSALATGAALARREISAVELTEHMLRRIEFLDPVLHAYATVTAERALAEARRADAELDRGERRGPLHGVPVGVKDLAAVAGVPTVAGMPIRRGCAAGADSTVVTRLGEAGMVLLGTLQMTEGAYFEHHPDVPAPVNPWDPALWSGASSSGPGVAVAAGLAFAAIGSDTGGSIRFPAAANRIVGLKPTRGAVNLDGTVAAAPSLDHLGPLARTVPDAGAVLRAIAEPGTTTGADGAPPRVAVVDGFLDEIDDDAAAAYVSAREELRATGVEIVRIDLPDTSGARDAWAVLCASEAAHQHAATYPSRAGEYGAVAGFLDVGRSVDAITYLSAVDTRRRFTREFLARTGDTTALLVPTQPETAIDIDIDIARKDELIADADALGGFIRFATPFDMTGQPVVTVPVGARGSVQLVGRPGHDESLIALAAHLDVAARIPPAAP